MKQLAMVFTATMLLLGCAASSAKNPILNLRAQAGDYIFVYGGVFDGAAAEQELSLIVFPNDAVHRVYSNTDWETGDTKRYFSAPIHLTSGGIYGRLLDATPFLPNKGASNLILTTNFIVERSVGGKKSWGSYRGDSDRVKEIQNIVTQYARACWNFG